MIYVHICGSETFEKRNKQIKRRFISETILFVNGSNIHDILDYCGKSFECIKILSM